MTDNPRIDPCASCDGDGGWEGPVYGYCSVTGAAMTTWTVCPSCNGRTWEAVEARLIDEDDLDDFVPSGEVVE